MSWLPGIDLKYFSNGGGGGGGGDRRGISYRNFRELLMKFFFKEKF